ncbi:uncharacterized protein LOC117227846 [Megalopta genalis]|uniref:uncharacterized protein LOC117227846 n=1 Tax=Megalopta genalis TaxID=115081 RepID=UPI003FD3045E
MSIITFSEEFTKMVGRWKEFVPTGNGGLAPRLTNQEIIDAVRNVLRLTLNTNPDIPDYSPVRTPVTGIEIRTPDTPVAPKFNRSQLSTSLGRYGSLDTLVTEDQEHVITVHDQGEEFDANETVVHVDKDEESTKPMRRLSNIASAAVTIEQPSTSTSRSGLPSKQRRSVAVPGTPTSSKITSTLKAEKMTSSTRRRSIAAVKPSSAVSSTSNTPSAVVAPMVRSPISTRKSKYAYVQSTIPKTARAVRKSTK